MIKINTSHILPDVPYLLEGTESSDVLGLPPDAVPPLVPAGDITYRLSAVMAGAVFPFQKTNSAGHRHPAARYR